MSKNTLIDAVVLKPKAEPEYSVIWLHGLGADGHDFEDVVPMLGLESQGRFIFPHAPVRPITLNQGMPMRAWYDIESLEDRSKEDEEGIRESQQLIEAWIDNEVSIVGSQRVFVIGFSQGGAMAAHCALRYAQPLAGCGVLSGYMCLSHTLEAELAQENKTLPIYMAHGTRDPMVQFAFAQRSHAFMEEANLDVQFETYPMEHNVCIEEMESLGRWMQKASSKVT